MMNMFSLTYLFVLGLILVDNCHCLANKTSDQGDLILNWIYSVQNSTDDRIIDAIKLIDEEPVENKTETTSVKAEKESITTTQTIRTTTMTTTTPMTVATTTTEAANESTSDDPMVLLMNKVRSNEVLTKALIDFAASQGKQLVKVSKYEFPPFYLRILEGNDFYWDTKREWGLIVGPFAAISAGIIILCAAYVWWELLPHRLPLHPTLKTDDD